MRAAAALANIACVKPNAAPPNQLVAENYDEFRRVARGVLNGDAQKLQIQPTDLAHAAAIKLFALNRVEVNGRTHFLSLSARIMRQILMDEVRRLRAAKRQAPPVTTQWPGDAGAPLDLEVLDVALTKLEDVSPELARLVEQRFFAGLTVEEIAIIDGVSDSTVKRQWRAARAWLVNEMQAGG
ncbi:MAG: ECF-type sigma factor [Hyphomonadaceae bacterium JAD_PAG50586_4]|nr:MAG: ECF-type sigma factor [Hyphomonadaceae bacterium JAD_PAG50586_4]